MIALLCTQCVLNFCSIDWGFSQQFNDLHAHLQVNTEKPDKLG
jgi:hypothetical protein